MPSSEILSILSIIFGWITLGLVCAYSIPQFIKIIRTKNTSSNSVIVFAAFSLSSTLSLILAIGNMLMLIDEGKQLTTTWCVLVLLPAITYNSLNIVLNVTSLIIKIRHLKLCKKFNIDEIELAKRLLANKKGAK